MPHDAQCCKIRSLAMRRSATKRATLLFAKTAKLAVVTVCNRCRLLPSTAQHVARGMLPPRYCDRPLRGRYKMSSLPGFLGVLASWRFNSSGWLPCLTGSLLFGKILPLRKPLFHNRISHGRGSLRPMPNWAKIGPNRDQWCKMVHICERVAPFWS